MKVVLADGRNTVVPDTKENRAFYSRQYKGTVFESTEKPVKVVQPIENIVVEEQPEEKPEEKPEEVLNDAPPANRTAGRPPRNNKT